MAKKLNFEQCKLSNDGIPGVKILEARWPRVIIQKRSILGFQCELLFGIFLPFCGKMEKGGGGVKGPLGPPNYDPLMVYEISGITKSAGLPLVRRVVGFVFCTYSECFCTQQKEVIQGIGYYHLLRRQFAEIHLKLANSRSEF